MFMQRKSSENEDVKKVPDNVKEAVLKIYYSQAHYEEKGDMHRIQENMLAFVNDCLKTNAYWFLEDNIRKATEENNALDEKDKDAQNKKADFIKMLYDQKEIITDYLKIQLDGCLRVNPRRPAKDISIWWREGQYIAKASAGVVGGFRVRRGQGSSKLEATIDPSIVNALAGIYSELRRFSDDVTATQIDCVIPMPPELPSIESTLQSSLSMFKSDSAASATPVDGNPTDPSSAADYKSTQPRTSQN